MKPLGIIVGVIVIVTLASVVFSYVRHSNEAKNAMKEASQLEEDVLGMMTSSEEKIREAQKLLSKENSTSEDQIKAKQLINESIADARKAVDAQPNNPRTWYYLSEAYQKFRSVNPKAVELSLDALNHAIPLAPNDPKLLNERATIYIDQKKYKEAEEDLTKAIVSDPNLGNLYFKLGNVYKETDRKEKARELYLLAQKLTPQENKLAHAQIEYKLEELKKGKGKK